jgi:sugar-specific transcriptional regulator TrmB
MEISDLIKLGFNKNEAKVYLALIRLGKADAREIINSTKFHRNIVYDNLDKLIEKGLVTFIIEKSKKNFSIAKPNSLSQYFKEEEESISEKKKLAESIEKEIESLTNKVIEKQDATIFRGVKAVKSFYEDVINNGDYYVLGAPSESVEIMGELFWETHHMKMRKNKNHSFLLLNPSLKKWGNKQKGAYSEIRYFKKDFEPKTEIHIQNGTVAIIVWTEEPLIFLINNKSVYDSYKNYFNMLWKIAKK